MKVKGGVYRHHRGGLYRVLMLATESTNARVGRPVVVYVSLTTGELHTRDQSEFCEPVKWPDGSTQPRFMPVVQSLYEWQAGTTVITRLQRVTDIARDWASSREPDPPMTPAAAAMRAISEALEDEAH